MLASDIPANIEVGLPPERHFALGNIAALAARLDAAPGFSRDAIARDTTRRWVVERYDWHVVAQQTLSVYRAALA